MARYHATFTTPAAAAGAALVDFRASATDRARILEIGVFASTAVVNVLGLKRSTTLGTASTTVTPVAGEPGDPPPTALVGTAWSVAPAASGISLRTIWLPGNIGAGVIWTFASGDMVVPLTSAIGIFNVGAAAGGVCVGYVMFGE